MGIPYDPDYHPLAKDIVWRAQDKQTYAITKCLEFTNYCVLEDRNSNNVGHYGSARDARNATPEDHRYGNPDAAPPGAVMYFTNGSADGHIVPCLGNGMVRSTGFSLQIRDVHWTQIVNAWGGRPFAFWTDWFLGYTINLSSTSGDAGTIIPPEIITKSKESDMDIIGEIGGGAFGIEPGFIKWIGTTSQLATLGKTTGDRPLVPLDPNEFQEAIWNYGLEEFTVAQVQDLYRNFATTGVSFLVASWRKPVAEAQFTPAQLDALATSIAGKIKVPGLSAADLTAIGKLDDAEFANIAAQLAKTPAATLAAFGLQRVPA